MHSLEKRARFEGLRWAEQMYVSMRLRGERLPEVWPGSLEEARALVAAFTGSSSEQESLTHVLLSRAGELWRDLVTPSFRIAS